jgi:hypothetical protein
MEQTHQIPNRIGPIANLNCGLAAENLCSLCLLLSASEVSA